ncbi:MAG: hypothetical protein ACREC4_03450 [Methylocella sp.]
MEQNLFAGIAVAKDRLGVHGRPQDKTFATGRDDAGLAELIAGSRQLAPRLIVVAATGGDATVGESARWRGPSAFGGH